MESEYLPEGTVLLPEGLVLQDGRRLRHATLRALSGREEEWMARHPHTPNAIKVTWLLEACLLSLDNVPATVDLIRQLLVGDREYLVLQLRRLTLGDDIHTVTVCPACQARMDTDLRIGEVPVEFRPQASSTYTVSSANRTVRFRLPAGGDQEAVLGETCAAETLFDRCVLDDGGQRLSEDERQMIIQEMERHASSVEVELDLTCPDCEHRFSQPLDITTYFFDELNVNSKQLLREVHTLALYYHWSEPDILSLRRDRRREYLGLLHESLRPQV